MKALPGHRKIGRGACRSTGVDGVGTPVHSSGTRFTLANTGGGPRDPSARPSRMYPFPSASSSASESAGGAWVRQFGPPCVPPGHAVSRCSGPDQVSKYVSSPCGAMAPARPPYHCCRPAFRQVGDKNLWRCFGHSWFRCLGFATTYDVPPGLP